MSNLSQNCDTLRRWAGSLNRRKCRVAQIDRFIMRERQRGEGRQHAFDFSEVTERQGGPQSEVLSRCVCQDVSQRPGDHGTVRRYQDSALIAQLPDDVNAHVLAFVWIP
jgi:hypothetical protein